MIYLNTTEITHKSLSCLFRAVLGGIFGNEERTSVPGLGMFGPKDRGQRTEMMHRKMSERLQSP